MVNRGIRVKSETEKVGSVEGMPATEMSSWLEARGGLSTAAKHVFLRGDFTPDVVNIFFSL